MTVRGLFSEGDMLGCGLAGNTAFKVILAHELPTQSQQTVTDKKLNPTTGKSESFMSVLILQTHNPAKNDELCIIK